MPKEATPENYQKLFEGKLQQFLRQGIVFCLCEVTSPNVVLKLLIERLSELKYSEQVLHLADIVTPGISQGALLHTIETTYAQGIRQGQITVIEGELGEQAPLNWRDLTNQLRDTLRLLESPLGTIIITPETATMHPDSSGRVIIYDPSQVVRMSK